MKFRNLLMASILSVFAFSVFASEEYVGTFSKDSVKIRWVRVSQADIGNVCARNIEFTSNMTESNLPVGCAKPGWELNTGHTCTVYASVPKSDYGMSILGHEILHCFIGDFHN